MRWQFVATECPKVRDELARDGPTCGKREFPSLTRPVVGPSFQPASQALQERFWRLQSTDAGFRGHFVRPLLLWASPEINSSRPRTEKIKDNLSQRVFVERF